MALRVSCCREAAGAGRRGGRCVLDAEVGDARLQLLGLRGELLGGRGHLLGRAGVLLGDLVELLDRLVDLRRADILLAAGGGDFRDQLGGLLDVGHQPASISPASCAAFTVCADSVPISAAAAWLRSASLRTSEATTAKPLPCSPARAASTAAFSASRSVWRAISCTMVIFSAMVCIASTARPTASPLASASLADCRAIFSVWLALSAFCLMFAAISSIEEEASSADEACSVAPCESCSALADSSWLPEETLSAAASASLTTSRKPLHHRVDVAGQIAEFVARDMRLGLREIAGRDRLGERTRTPH